MKKNFLTGLLSGVVMIVVTMVVSCIFNLIAPSIKIEYLNPEIFRPWSDPLMSLMFLCPLISGVILAFIWSAVKNVIKDKSLANMGLKFGLVYFLISIPGMIMSYSTFQVSFVMILSWTVGIFFSSLCAGLLYAKILK